MKTPLAQDWKLPTFKMAMAPVKSRFALASSASTMRPRSESPQQPSGLQYELRKTVLSDHLALGHLAGVSISLFRGEGDP